MNKNEKRTQAAKKRTSGPARSPKKKQTGKGNQHNRDISSKDVFSNPVLCAQFLRDNLDIQLLKNIQPEDIEDVSERYHPYLGTEFEADSVNKIRILGIDKEPSFLVSLIDHKSLVDYDVPMQLMRYMVCIWTEYRRAKEAEKRGSTKRKDFRYPVIIPIVYFEGKNAWTAARNFKDRIERSDEFRKWIPDFQYELVSVHDYENQDLLRRGNEMSLIMLINKIQDSTDLEKFIRIPADQLNRIVKDSLDHVVEAIVSVMESLCFKMDVTAEERAECVQKVRARKMGYLWENMDKFSIQEERRKTAEQRKKTEEERKKTEEQRKKTEEQRKKAEEQRKKAEEQRKKAEEQRKKAEEQRQKTAEQQKRAETAEENLSRAEAELRETKEKLKTAEALIKQLSNKLQT